MSVLKCSIKDISPFVRFAGKCEFNAKSSIPLRCTVDHRLFFVLKGEVRFTAEDEVFELTAGDVVLLLAGIPYKMDMGENNVILVSVNFNFFTCGNEPEPAFSLPMYCPENFNRDMILERPEFTDGFLKSGIVTEKGITEIRPYLEKMTDEFKRMEPFYSKQVSRYLGICLTVIYRRIMGERQGRGPAGHKDILSYLARHFNEPITNKEVAEKFHYHPNYVNQLIKEQTGLSLHKYLLRLRMLSAVDLLLSTEMSVNDIAAVIGFSDASYFSQYFRKCYGCSPNKFRNAQ